MLAVLDVLKVLFGFLSVTSALLAGLSWKDRYWRCWPSLWSVFQKCKPMQPQLVITAVVCGLIAAGAEIGKAILSPPPPIIYTQGHHGLSTPQATLDGFEKDLKSVTDKRNNEARAYFKAAEHDFANGRLQEAINGYRKSINVIPTPSAYLNLGVSLWYLSDFQQAENAFTDGIRIAREQRDSKLEAAFLNGIGSTYFDRGRIDEALQSFRDAYKFCKRRGDLLCQGAVLGNIGNIHRNQQKFETALARHRESFDLFKKAGDQIGQARSLQNIGNVYHNQGKLEEALKALQDALKLHRQFKDLYGMAGAYINIGIVHFDQGKLDESLRSYHTALKLFKELDHRLGQATALMNIGNFYFFRGELKLAWRPYQEALQLYKQLGHRQGQVQIHQNLHDIQWQTETLALLGISDKYEGKYCQAIERLMQAHHIYQVIDPTHKNVGTIEYALLSLQDQLESCAISYLKE
jgi:tetratricopeptide (TPR) repeat protein